MFDEIGHGNRFVQKYREKSVSERLELRREVRKAVDRIEDARAYHCLVFVLSASTRNHVLIMRQWASFGRCAVPYLVDGAMGLEDGAGDG